MKKLFILFSFFLIVQTGNAQTGDETKEIRDVLRERVAVGKTKQSIVVTLINVRLIFNRGADGKIESLTLHQNGEQIAKKVK